MTPDQQPGPALTTGLDGWAALAPDGIWWWKDASLAGELDRHYRDWDARGRPALEDYHVSFVPIGQPGDLSAGSWQIERRFYREVMSLGHAGLGGLSGEAPQVVRNIGFLL